VWGLGKLLAGLNLPYRPLRFINFAYENSGLETYKSTSARAGQPNLAPRAKIQGCYSLSDLSPLADLTSLQLLDLAGDSSAIYPRWQL
jgi:hypothetical protein